MVALRVISMKCSIPLLRDLEGDEQGKPQTTFTILRDKKKLDIIIEPALITINPASGDKVR